MRDRRVIILFVKHPEPGRVKTRLARTLGDEEAADIYRRLVEYLLHMLPAVGADEVRVYFDPADKQREVEQWLRPHWQEGMEQLALNDGEQIRTAIHFCPQSSGDLGQRLHNSFQQVFHDGREPKADCLKVLAMGSDCIEINGDIFHAAWTSLGEKDLVFGPSADGGYYLLGLKSFHPCLFEEIPWSTTETLQTSLARAEEHFLSVALLEEKHDIDTEEDWRRAKPLLPPEESTESL